MTTETAVQTRVREVQPSQAKELLESGRATLVDVREPDEVVAERIEGAVSMPLSRFDPCALPKGAIVFQCGSGRRSLEAAARAGDREELFSLTGGIKGWRAAGLATVRTKVPISIMRQVQITAGSIVLIFSLLAVMVSPWFGLGAAFIGAGLVFAGASGTCGMAAMLARMPWNAALRGCAKK